MSPEQKQVFEDVIELCRSASAISRRDGKDTNWGAFASRAQRALDAYHNLIREEAHREDFEMWARSEPFFAHSNGETFERDDQGYTEANVHGAWMSYLAHVPKSPRPTAPFSKFQLPAVPTAPAAPEDEVGYPSDGTDGAPE